MFVYHIQAINTADEQVRDALDRKDTTQAALLDAMKSKIIMEQVVQ